jgi:hypothetical protein
MIAEISHQKNMAMGWDISVSVKPEAGQAISAVEVSVNGFNRLSENFHPPASQWQKTLIQQGQYPGENQVEVKVTDSKGTQTRSLDQWS